MTEVARIQRIVELVKELWTYNQSLTLGGLLEKWIWADYIATRGDIFHPRDVETEERLNDAIQRAKTSSKPEELSNLQTEVLTLVADLWPAVPNQRFGQFLSNYAFGHFMSHPPKKMLEQPDETILDALRQWQRR